MSKSSKSVNSTLKLKVELISPFGPILTRNPAGHPQWLTWFLQRGSGQKIPSGFLTPIPQPAEGVIYNSSEAFPYYYHNPPDPTLWNPPWNWEYFTGSSNMAPSMPPPPGQIGPHPSYIHVSQQYIFQQQIAGQMIALGANPTREDTFRLQGVQWIDDVRVALQLPVRTFCTAVTYFHKFRLVHRDNEYGCNEAAAASLLAACKIEDTLKKSRDILCAAHNLKTSGEPLGPDDPYFEVPSKVVIGLERLMLEASGFDFRVRYPHKHLIKLARAAGVDKDVTKIGYLIMMDLYKTFAPLKQTCPTMAFACMELATLIAEKQENKINGERAPSYRTWATTRGEIIESILDILDLYTHFQKTSPVASSHNVEKFIGMKIKFNQEIERRPQLARNTEWHEVPKISGFKSNIKTPKTPITPNSPSDTRMNGMEGVSPATLSPRSSGSGKRGIGARGQDGTVRFMLDAEQARQEKETTSEYFKVEYEEYEVEVEEPIKPEREERGPRPHGQRHGRDDRPFHYNNNKRSRR